MTQSQQDVSKNKNARTAADMFKYLAEYTQLRMRQQRTMDSWIALWAADWPDEPEVASVFRSQDADHSGHILSVKKPRLEPAPVPPELILPWLDVPSTRISSADAPRVRSVLRVAEPITVDEEGGPLPQTYREERLQDHPEIERAIREYLVKKWAPWAERDRGRRAVQSLYATLFSWWQKQVQAGEQWELLVGIGLLQWKDRGNGDAIRRPLVAIPVRLAMDDGNATMVVSVQADGAGPQLELDMLAPNQRPSSESMRRARDLIVEHGGDMLDPAVSHVVLRTVCDLLAPDSEYREEGRPTGATEDHPVVTFAPLLCMRKRSEKTMNQMLSAIESQIEETGYIPPGIAAVLGMPAEQRGERDGSDAQTPAYRPEDQIVFFPKKSNDDQRTIVRKLAASRGGLIVQGPPGTGKSHTIANLVCDLLARGNRVLVTSKGARALNVLRDMLPTEVQALCVLLLGADHQSNQSLEQSIRAISQGHEAWRPERAEQQKKRLFAEREAACRDESRILAEMREIREAETESVEAPGDYARGTRASIAQQVRSDAERYGWIATFFRSDTDPGELLLAAEACVSLAAELDALSPDDVADLDGLSANDVLPTDAAGFLDALARFESAAEALDRFAEHSNEVEWTEGLGVARAALASLRDDLRSALGTGALSGEAINVLRESVEGDLGILEDDFAYLEALLQDAPSEDLLDAELSVPQEIGMAQLKVDSERLLAHLQQGGGLGLGPFRPRVVKECRYILEDCRVDGALCTDAVSVARLNAAVNEKERVRKACARLSRHSMPSHGSYSAQFSDLRALHRQLSAARSIASQVPPIREECAAHDFGFVPEWTSVEGLERMLSALDYAQARHVLGIDTSELDRLADASARAGDHPEYSTLAAALRLRDKRMLDASLKRIAELNDTNVRVGDLLRAKSRLAEAAPSLAAALFEWGDPDAPSRLRSLPKAWTWLRAELWLRRVCDPQRQEQLADDLERVQGRIASCTASLAAELAWGHCLSAMTEGHRRHLEAWSQAMKKLGKGTGKYAPLHRGNAREHMQHCKDVIPAWIMPLYKVAETLDPRPNIFDVAIVDEASQCGPEALFVSYIAKKVIIVGDDQQISPDEVGMNINAVQALVDVYLEGIPFKGAFGAKSSLFDQGKQFFGHPLRLREHFRCMPEIIQFSNSLCYADQPLEPLRQYGGERLQPIVVRKVADGYQTDGKGSTNLPEAEAVVEKLGELCAHPAYKGKTFGVISLLSSSAQAQLIEKLLLERLDPAEIASRRIICGDAYDFQGDERDVILLSMVSAPNRRIGTLSSDADKRRFNVAVSRAKDQLWLFHSADVSDLGHNCYRRKLLEYCRNPTVEGSNFDEDGSVASIRRAAEGRREPGRQPEPFDSWFEVDVYLRILDRGFRVVPQYQTGGYFIDLMVQGMNGSLAVECDGEYWHGPEQYDADVARQRKLERCGLRFWRLGESVFRRDPEAAMESLWSRLDELGIRSAADDAAHQAELIATSETSHDAGEHDELPAAPEDQPTPVHVHDEYVTIDVTEVDAGEPIQESSSSPTSRDAAEGAPAVARSGGPAKPYLEWSLTRLPKPCESKHVQVQSGLLEILQAEGPMCVEHLYRQYARGAGIQRVRSVTRAHLDRAMSALVYPGHVKRRTEYLPGDSDSLNVAWIAERPDVIVRERGPRELLEVPPSEMVELLARMRRLDKGCVRTQAAAVRALQEAYAVQRVSSHARVRFEAVYDKLMRSDAM